MTSVITATTDVVISVKSKLELARLDRSGTAVSRISTMRIRNFSRTAALASRLLNLRDLRVVDHLRPFLQLDVDPRGEFVRRVGDGKEAERGELLGDVRRLHH